MKELLHSTTVKEYREEEAMHHELLSTVRHGLIMAIMAMIMGALWAGYLASQHERLHSGFEAQDEQMQSAQMQHLLEDISKDTEPHSHSHEVVADANASVADEHSHSGSLAADAMQRLLRGHIHFMGLGVLTAVLLLVTAATSLKPCWQRLLGWTFGIGALAYPPAWILMGLRTVELGSGAAEASVIWLFGPAVGLLLASMMALLVVLVLEAFGLQHRLPVLKRCFRDPRS